MNFDDKTPAELEALYKELVAKVPTKSPIYLPTQKVPLRDRVSGMAHVRQIYDHDLDALYRPRMRALREQFKGRERCFLIGNGPSLNRTDLSMLKDEATFAVNGFFLKARDLDWTPTFYCVEDHLVAEDRAPWISDFKGPIKFFPAYLGYMFPQAEDTIFYNHRGRVSYPHGFDFSLEADKITYTGCTVTFSMMQLAAYLGFREIYLIGVDASYDIPTDAKEGSDYGVGVLDMKSDDPNHFDPDYFGKGFRWHDPQVSKMVEAYGEARRVLETQTSQRIYNATVGGQLEVFERRSFASLFPQARPPERVQHDTAVANGHKAAAKAVRLALDLRPKLLIIDMTPIGGPSATGQIKQSFFGDWHEDRLMQICSTDLHGLDQIVPDGDGGYKMERLRADDALQAIDDFAPEMILYRPLADRKVLHNFAMQAIETVDAPLVIWIMDDWPARLQAHDPTLFAGYDADLRWLLQNATLRLSICDAMSTAFEARYGLPFQAFANGIDPALWDQPRVHTEGGPLLIRYAGGITSDMTEASLRRLADAVEACGAAGQDLRFEIATRNNYYTKFMPEYEGLRFTHLEPSNRTAEQYRQWLCGADVAVIAYNFDPKSIEYVRYSMANKMPECLASGAALLAYGPRELATIDYVARQGVAEVVQTEDAAALQAAIGRLGQARHRSDLSRAGRKLVLTRHSLPILKDAMAGEMIRHAGVLEKLPTVRSRRPPAVRTNLNVYVTGSFTDQSDWDNLITRLAFYLAPYLRYIDRIEMGITRAQLDTAALKGAVDPVIETHMAALKAKIRPASQQRLREELNKVNPKSHLLLVADTTEAEGYKTEIARFRSHGRFFDVDPVRTRMEGSYMLWAGLKGFVDVAAETRRNRVRFAAMQRDIGQFDKAYVFGTGPGLGDFVAKTDFSDGLCIIANSIVKNDDFLDRMKPRIIVAADPIFHSGCSSYAAAFRASLATALEKTGAWFLCPMRDLMIYQTYLPQFADRIIGIPFDAKAPPPSDLGKTFALKPYPNILTLLLLPVAATFAREIHIAGCDGRQITDDAAFWAHDPKAQFVDEMDNIKRVHPAFFAIDYNNYYIEHSRDLETVLQSLEADGRVCINGSPSYIPALQAREPAGMRPQALSGDRPFAPVALAIIDPDAKGDWGHYLSYDRQLGRATRAAGMDFTIIGRQDLPAEARPQEANRLIRTLSLHSWEIGIRGMKVKASDLSRFAREMDDGLTELEAAVPTGDIAIFMYCGAIEVAEVLEHVLMTHPRARALITLFYSFNFDITDPVYAARWAPLMRRLVTRPGRVRLIHATPQITAEFEAAIDVRLPVLPHPSTTFGDVTALELAQRPGPDLQPDSQPRILFPGGARKEKGFLLGAGACADLADTTQYDLVLRARLDDKTLPELRAAVEALDPARVTLSADDFGEKEFVGWLASADVMVVPYLPEAFSNRTSGMLVDAMLLGIPVVVIEGTWLADEVAVTGGGVCVPPTVDGIVEGVRQVLAHHAEHVAATRHAAQRYLETGSWAYLTTRIVDVLQGLPHAQSGPEQEVTSPQEAGHPGASATDMPVFHALPGTDDATAPPCAFVYSRCGRFLSHAVSRGIAPSAALDLWLTGATALLTAFRPVRRHAVLVDMDTLAVDPEGLLQALERQGLAAPAPADLIAVTEAAAQTGTPDDPLQELIAATTLRQSARARKLEAELEARALPMAATAPDRIDMDAVFANSQATLHSLGTDRHLLSQSREAIRTQAAIIQDLHTVRAQTTTTQIVLEEQNRALQGALLRQDLARRTLERTASAAQAERAAAVQDCDDRIRGLRAELVNLHKGHDALVRAQADSAAAVQDRDVRIAGLQAERSRNHQELETGKLHLADSARTVADQDMQIQAIEAVLAEQKSASRTTAEQQKSLQDELAVAQDKAVTLAKDLQSARARNAVLEARAKAAEIEIDRIFNSKSWRITQPMRSTRQLFKPNTRGN